MSQCYVSVVSYQHLHAVDANGSYDEQNDTTDPETGMFHGTGHGEYARPDVAFDEVGQRFQVPVPSK